MKIIFVNCFIFFSYSWFKELFGRLVGWLVDRLVGWFWLVSVSLFHVRDFPQMSGGQLEGGSQHSKSQGEEQAEGLSIPCAHMYLITRSWVPYLCPLLCIPYYVLGLETLFYPPRH